MNNQDVSYQKESVSVVPAQFIISPAPNRTVKRLVTRYVRWIISACLYSNKKCYKMKKSSAVNFLNGTLPYL